MASILRRIFGKTDTDGTWVQADSTLTAKVLGYAGRTTDRKQIRDTIVRRYGTTITREKDSSGTDFQVFTKGGFDARMRAGHIETVSVGLGHKIAGAIATMFSEPTQNFDLLGAEGAEGADTTDAAELLADMRDGEQYIEALVQADTESVWTGCAPVFTEFVDGKLRYHVIDPGKIQVFFESVIESNGVNRPTNRMDIEDATTVVIETGVVDIKTKSYIAIFGRSTANPNGRYVSFLSSGDGREIPEYGDDNSFDWVTGGERANPLSKYASMHPDLDLPEYPIIIIQGGVVRRDALMSATDSLLQEALEADVAASHIRATSGDNARGTLAFKKSDAGGTQPVPKNLRGEVILEFGQELDSINHDASAPKISWEILQEEMVSTGQGYTVPDYYTSSKDHTVEAASGKALKVRARQLAKLRDRRVAINTPEVEKEFEIEKAFISLMAEADESTINLLESCTQTWDAGSQYMPEDDTEKVSLIEKLVDLGVYDTIEAIRLAYNLSDEEEAVVKYEQLAKRMKKYPPLYEAEGDGEGEGDGKNENSEEEDDNNGRGEET